MNTSHSMMGLMMAAAIGLGAFAPSVSATQQTAPTGDHSSSAAEAVTDAWITAKVKAELATTKGVDSNNISVTTVDGVVTLTGVQPTKLAVSKAIAVARGIKGVKDVDAAGLAAN